MWEQGLRHTLNPVHSGVTTLRQNEREKDTMGQASGPRYTEGRWPVGGAGLLGHSQLPPVLPAKTEPRPGKPETRGLSWGKTNISLVRATVQGRPSERQL